MIDFSWQIFSQTGNIETYLLMKELETIYESDSSNRTDEDTTELDRHM
ncbi:YqzL family protein [Aquibacillus halophilus]|uniref:YqzL family protein n=1 Tax=Aquibacillus halophilus TaxID=930132 RepID=A0A6A8DPA3_9BACI|nr:YqzL family protein [Aquibacillus halophilus]